MEILKSLVNQGYEIEFGYENSIGNTEMSHDWKPLKETSFNWLTEVSENLEENIKDILESNKKDLEEGFEEGSFVSAAGYEESDLEVGGTELLKVLFSLRQKQED